MLESLVNKGADPKACNFVKQTSTQKFFSEYCEISKSRFFYRTPPVASSYFLEPLFNAFHPSIAFDIETSHTLISHIVFIADSEQIGIVILKP